MVQRLSRFLRQRLAAGDDGKTFLIGWHGDSPQFALAAGLRGASDHPRFLTFARYLVHRRFDCDGWTLMLPVEVDRTPHYVVESHHGGAVQVLRSGVDGALEPAGLGGGLIGDLDWPGDALPGRLRRDLDRLYAMLQLALPD